MGIVRNLLVRVGVDLSDMQKKLKEAQKSFKNLGKDLNKIGDGLTKKLTLPIVAATAAFATMGLRAAKAAADMDDLAMVTNIGVEDLQAYAFAGEMLGTNLDVITGAQTKLTRAIAEADGGNKDAIKAFEDLGVKIYGVDGRLRSADEIFWDVLESLGKIEDPVTRDALAMKLMGKSAQELNPLIKAGADEFQRLMEKAKELGLILGEDQVAELAKLDDAWVQLQAQLGAAAAVILSALAPALTSLLESISENIPGIVDALTNLVNGFLALDPGTQAFILGAIGMLAALGPMIMVFAKIAGAISAVIGWVSGLIGAFGALASGTGSLGGVLVAIFGSVGGVIVAVIAVIAALILVFKHLWDTNEDFRNALIKIWTTIKDTLTPIIQGIWDFIVLAFNAIKESIIKGVQIAWDFLVTAWTAISDFMTLLLQGLCDFIVIAFNTIKDTVVNAVQVVWDFLVNAWTAISDFMTPILQGIWDFISYVWNEISTLIKNNMETIKNIITTVWEIIVATFKNQLKSISDNVELAWTVLSWTFKNSFNMILSGIKSVWNLIVGVFKVQFEIVKNVVMVMINLIKSIWDNFGFAIKASAEGMWTAIKAIFSGALKVIEGVLKVALGIITGNWDKAWEGVQLMFKGVWEAIVGTANGAMDAISGIVGGIVDNVKNAIKWVQDLIGLNKEASSSTPSSSGPSLPKVPKLAEGGILTRPTLNIAGEAGPEAVIPLSKLDSMVGSGSKETVVQVILDGRVIQEFVDTGLGTKSLSFGGTY